MIKEEDYLREMRELGYFHDDKGHGKGKEPPSDKEIQKFFQDRMEKFAPDFERRVNEHFNKMNTTDERRSLWDRLHQNHKD